MRALRPRTWLLALVFACACASAAAARVVTIPVSARVGGPRSESGDGLLVRFRDVDVNAGCTLAFCAGATDTVTVQTTVMPNVNYLLNTGTLFGPFNFGGSFFETRWDAWINIKVAGDYVFSEQVDDGASVAIADSTILWLDGGHWFVNATSDTVRFVYPGLYPFRAYFFDCPVCCRGFRLGAMGPAGSGMMAWTPGFDFNADLGPCCTYGGNGPGLSVIPGALFFRTMPTSGVEPASELDATGALLGCWAGPNPSRGPVLLAIELAREQRVWVDVFDAAGRRVATLADGVRCASGRTRWPWSAAWSGRGAAASGTWFYRVRTEDGSHASGRIVTVR